MYRLLLLTSAALSAENSPLRLDKVSIHLFLENRDAFSDDITSVSGFSAWNFRPSGIGFSDDDRFHSFLIKVWFSSAQETFQAGEQARVLVKSEKTGKVLFNSTIKGVYIAKDGRTVKPLLVSGYGSARPSQEHYEDTPVQMWRVKNHITSGLRQIFGPAH